MRNATNSAVKESTADPDHRSPLPLLYLTVAVLGSWALIIGVVALLVKLL